MANGKYDVVCVKGAVPEKFTIVWTDPTIPNQGFINMGDGMSETDMRKELEKRQISKGDIDALIENARKDPK